MPDPNISTNDLAAIFAADTPLIDVRAPVEFIQGSLPGAVNLPILNDEERAYVGTTYKQNGSEAAVKLGYELISGAVKQARLQQWLDFIQQHPRTVLYCFRGGQRSRITQQWLRDAGIDRPLITGGYKLVRQFLINTISYFSEHRKLLVITGPTGSGKTRLIHDISNCCPTLDIEAIARHRGSAFGSMSTPQPSQADFENQLAVSLLKLEQHNPSGPVIVEDESRNTGKVYLPVSFFEHMRSAEIIWVDEPLEARVNNIFEDYILTTSIGHAQQARRAVIPPAPADETGITYRQALMLFDRYATALQAISKKLGGDRFQEILLDLNFARSDFENRNEIQANKIWIEKLVSYYYDPLYLGSLQRRQVNPCFKGSRQTVMDYLRTRQNALSRTTGTRY
ncbi:tRNA 2-selenouridine(34) synthase MnmH [Nitrosomonas sp.]|uniref:tRNA 2-selenouridine(34) synthase MnmH n=1 Tax=Nitrosomonas sp. TaxID=42353 RepID=UPI0025F01DAA|nr:tRNA 2-selenouridine(34) synthase MnmH [Nitrosomonas sp.]MCC6916280.1 tRNA 2-selenouridine(34) synthase MnmH [Nitrosomonas sp.]